MQGFEPCLRSFKKENFPMKRTLFLVLLFALISSVAQAQQSFRMICKGGAGIKAKISPGDVGNSFQKLGLFFNKSPRAAGQNGAKLANGTCAWVDRPLNSAEPDILAQDIRPGYRYHVDLDAGKHVVRFQPTNNIYNWVNVLRIPGRLWTFYAYNTNQGELKVTQSYQGTGVPID
jgi:hypothetical protein